MSEAWPAKDPSAVLDYVYRAPLDEGDSIGAGGLTITKLSGSVTLQSQSLAAVPDTVDGKYGQAVTVWIAGGTDDETCVFKAEWTTTGGRTADDIITLPVASSDLPDLILTGYVKPLAGHLIARYPAFASVPTSTIRAWLTDAERFVTTAWGETDYAAGLMSLAAHNMALAGLGTDNTALAGVPAGVTAMKSGSLAINVSPEAANAKLSGDLTASRYGQEYALLLRANRGGPLVAPTGVVPCGSYGFERLPWAY